jgi:predicted phosphoadenosine phosphosulfate sulfurtransferase
MANKVLKKKQIDQDVWTLALERTRRAYDLFDHIAVSFSGGKDSTTALHVALEIAAERNRLPLDVFFWDEEAIHPETIDYMRRVSQRDDVNLRWLCVPIKHRNACSRSSPWWFPWAQEDKDKWCRELPPEATTELPGFNRQTVPECNGFLFPKSMGTIGIIMGIRAAESLRRYRSVAKPRNNSSRNTARHTP